jgi:hypothetical protein
MDYLSGLAEKNSCSLGSQYLTKQLSPCRDFVGDGEQGEKPIPYGISRLDFRGVLLIFWTGGQ